MSKARIFILSGPSGSGKTTLHKKLLYSRRLKGKLVRSLSATTRPRRIGEKHGRDYLFISKKQFLSKIKTGQLLEWQKVFDNYYGTPKHKAKQLLKKGKNVLLCIDVKGAKVVMRQFPDAVRIFVKTANLTVLSNRLRLRGSESAEDYKKRLRIARQELKEAKKYNYIVINDRVTKAVKKLETIILKEIKGGK